MTWDLSATREVIRPNGFPALEGSIMSPYGVVIALHAPAWKFIDCGDIGVVVFVGEGKNAVAYRADGSVAWSAGTGIRGAGTGAQGFTGGWCDGDTVRLYDPSGYSLRFRVADGEFLRIEQTK